MLRRLLGVVLMGLAGAYAAVPPFQLRDTQGTTHTPAEWTGQKTILLFFVTTDCPIGNSYVPELNRIREQYSGRHGAIPRWRAGHDLFHGGRGTLARGAAAPQQMTLQ